MDKVYHFQTQKGKAGHLKSVITGDQKLQFYSEEEYDSSQETPLNENSKRSPGNQQGGYQTDDGGSEGGTPKNSQNKNMNLKVSRFKGLGLSKKIEGDTEDDPDCEVFDSKKIPEERKSQDNDNHYNIEEQAEKIKSKIKDTPHKSKSKITLSSQAIVVNSDVEPKRSKISKEDKLANHKYRHLIYGPSVNEIVFKKYMILTQRGLIYAKKCLKGPSDKFIKSKQVFLPEALIKKDKTLVLDLDETLIHSCPPRDNPQVYVTAVGDFGEEAKIGINVRPYCLQFLTKLSQYYTIYVYTASSAAYANAIIKYLDPKKQYISGILTRSNCMETKNGFFIKDLRIIANKLLKDMLIVDNLAHSFGFQMENGIPILEYHNDQNDCELKYLIDYLIEAVKHDDLREYNKKLRLDDLIEFNIEE